MAALIPALNAFVWGAPSLVLILGVGVYLSLRLGWVQVRLLPRAVRMFLARLRPEAGEEGKSSFQALCTALAATVGTGNLVGVAGALCLGGPGAVFWMWICGILGMAIKYAEAALAVRWRVSAKTGVRAGPMYVMEQALGWKVLARCYCLLGLVASFGVGNAAQIHAAIGGINSMFAQWGFPQGRPINLIMGLLLAVLVGVMLLGSGKHIGVAAERLVPFAAVGYILLCCGVLVVNGNRIPDAFCAILRGAWNPRSVTGGALGSAFQALRVGCARGVFTNEAGMGTAGIAHGAAQVKHPAEQGLMGIMEVFLDTIVICTMTALVILTSGVKIPYGVDNAAALTNQAFASVYGTGATVLLSMSLILFALATVLGWGLYGLRCGEYLFGQGFGRLFSAAQVAVVVISAAMDTASVWQLCETINGLMVIPNLITLAVLTPDLCRLTKDYIKSGSVAAGGGNYADFYQRKPLRAFSYAEIPSSGCSSQERGQENLSSEHRSARSSHS